MAAYLLLALALLIALGFEFVEWFPRHRKRRSHRDLHAHSLEPNIAVVWSGLCNLAGVLASTGTVAFAVITLLPIELILQGEFRHRLSAMVFALLIAAILWNLGTWWFGLPASSSHTMVGSTHRRPDYGQPAPHAAQRRVSGVDWGQAMWKKVLKVLLISPLDWLSFLRVCLILVSKRLVKYPALYARPKDNQPPPWPVRAHSLLCTCTGASYFHGSNDGQKGMGLIMLILIGTVPTACCKLNYAVSPAEVQSFIASSQQAVRILDQHVGRSGSLGTEPRERNHRVSAPIERYIPDTVLAA